MEFAQGPVAAAFVALAALPIGLGMIWRRMRRRR